MIETVAILACAGYVVWKVREIKALVQEMASIIQEDLPQAPHPMGLLRRTRAGGLTTPQQRKPSLPRECDDAVTCGPDMESFIQEDQASQNDMVQVLRGGKHAGWVQRDSARHKALSSGTVAGYQCGEE